MKNKIFLKDLFFLGIVGIYPHEKQNKQPILVDLEIEIDSFREAIEKDEIKCSVDYDEIYQVVKTTIKSNHFNLIETLANEIVVNCFQLNEKIVNIKIKMTKPNAIAATKNLGIEINLNRQEIKQ